MTQEIIKDWIESTEDTIKALEEWKAKLEQWQRLGCCDSGEFQVALWALRRAGLEGWADGNPTGLDALAKAVIGAERLVELGEVEDQKEKDTAPNCEGNRPEGRKSGRRWVELKMIRGYGPYAYERWFEGGRKRSRYIGKVHEGKSPCQPS